LNSIDRPNNDFALKSRRYSIILNYTRFSRPRSVIPKFPEIRDRRVRWNPEIKTYRQTDFTPEDSRDLIGRDAADKSLPRVVKSGEF
jgi:hypothetical protein